MQQWFKIDFNDVFFNGLTTAEVGCVVKYKCACQQFGVDVLDDRKLRSIFNARELKFVRSYFQLCSDFVATSSQVCSEFVSTLSEVCHDFVPTLSEVCSKKDNKNNELDSPLYIEREKERNKENVIKESTPKVVQKQPIKKLPDDSWQMKPETIAKLKEKGLDATKVREKFINSCIAKNLKYIDFDRAVMVWDWSRDDSLKFVDDNWF